jgi:hypothetical protein
MSKLPVRTERDPLSPLTKALLALVQGLLPPLTGIAVGVWAVFTYIDHQKEARIDQAAQAAKENAARLFESQKPFNQKQLDLYLETAQVVGRLVSADESTFGKDDWNKDVRRFDALYWTELSMVEDEEVKKAMEKFRPVLQSLAKKNAMTEEDRLKLQAGSYHLAKSLNLSIASRWTVALSEVEETNIKLCISGSSSVSACPADSQKLDCGGSIEQWAKSQQCLSYSPSTISLQSGGMCGVQLLNVRCTKKRS